VKELKLPQFQGTENNVLGATGNHAPHAPHVPHMQAHGEMEAVRIGVFYGEGPGGGGMGEVGACGTEALVRGVVDEEEEEEKQVQRDGDDLRIERNKRGAQAVRVRVVGLGRV
jgi:hypothetical protein